VEFQPQRWKPRAKAVMTIDQLPIGDRELTVTVKADGEFTAVYYKRGGNTFSMNLWGTMRGESSPWLRELREALDRQPVQEAVILAETYGVEDGKMMKLPDTVHHLKNGDPRKIRLGAFDLISVNGRTANQSYLWRLQELETWLRDCKLVHVMPYIAPKGVEEIRQLWDEWITKRRYEGLFARDDRQNLYKVKEHLTIDAVVIGLNKRGAWERGEATSLKLALIDGDGSYVEIGDVASGIDHQLRKALFSQLKPYVRREFKDWTQVEPFIVVEVEATETFRAVKPTYRLLEGGSLEETGEREAHSLRHPRLTRFRSDKKATIEDAGYERQLPT
jgi:ATP-dependent DNA ligase